MAKDRDDSFGKEEENDLSLLKDYSKSLGRSADALLQSSKEFSKTAGSLNQGLSQTVSRLDKILGQAVDSFGSSENNFSRDKNQLDRNHLDRLERALSENQSERDQSIRKFSNTTSAFVKSFSQVASYAIGKFTAGFNSVVSSFEANLTSITVRMQKSNREYADMLDATTQSIKDDKLVTQFSQVDFIDQLNRVLDTGIRTIGETSAEDMAYRNMITSKLLPSINTNTRAYTRSSKLLGEEFSRSVVAIGKYTEGIYGMEGFDEAQFDAKLEQFSKSLIANASTEQEANSNIENFVAFYQKLTSEYGQEAAETISSQLIDQYYGLPGSNTMLATMGYGTPQDVASLLSGGAQAYDKFINALVSQYRAMDYNDPTMRSVLGNSLQGYDPRVAEEIIATDKFGKRLMSITEAMDKYDAEQEYQKQMDRLAAGDYQSKTAQQLKWNENATAKLGNFLAEHLPDTNGTLGLIFGLMGTWFTAWLAGGGGGGKGLVKSAVNFAGNFANGTAGTVGGAVGNKALSFGTNALSGTKVAGEVGSLGTKAVGASAALLTAAELAGGVVAIGSGIKDVADESVVNGDEVGVTKAIGGAAGLTGGALGAAMLAGAVSGPVGWIGLGVGAIGLLTAAVADSCKEINSFSEGITRVKSQTIKSLEDEKSSRRKAIDSIKELGLEEQREQLKELGIAQSDLIDKYGVSADALLSYSETLLTQQEYVVNEYNRDAKKDIDSQLKAKRDSTAEEILSQYEGTLDEDDVEFDQFVNQMESLGNSIQDEESRQKFFDMLDNITKNGKITKSERKGILGKGGFFAGFRAAFSGDFDLKNNYFNLADDAMMANEAYEDIGISEGNRFDTAKLEISQNPTFQNLMGAVRTYDKSAEGSFEREDSLRKITSILNNPDFNAYYHDHIKGVPDEHRALITDIAKANGITGYKTGLLKVPRDNMLARLHQGEMVLTAYQAKSLEDLAEGRDALSAYFKGILLGKGRVTVPEAVPQVSQNTEVFTNLIVDSIKSQTVEIVGVLNTILNVMTKGSSYRGASSSNFPEGLVTFQGY